MAMDNPIFVLSIRCGLLLVRVKQKKEANDYNL